jgi:uncharacterized DUF497 family protein
MYRRACASLVALCAAGASERWLAQRARRLISNGLVAFTIRRKLIRVISVRDMNRREQDFYGKYEEENP